MSGMDVLVTAGAFALVAFILWWFRPVQHGHSGRHDAGEPPVSSSVLRRQEQEDPGHAPQENKR